MYQDKKSIDNLSDDQRKQLRSIAAWTRKLDGQWSILGLTLGWDALLGLVPVVGDSLTACVSLGLVNKARKMQAPKRLLLCMIGNIVVDLLGGALPLAGDFFDFAWRANDRNLHLLEQYYGIEAAQQTQVPHHSKLPVVLSSLLVCAAIIFYFIYPQTIHGLFF